MPYFSAPAIGRAAGRQNCSRQLTAPELPPDNHPDGEHRPPDSERGSCSSELFYRMRAEPYPEAVSDNWQPPEGSSPGLSGSKPSDFSAPPDKESVHRIRRLPDNPDFFSRRSAVYTRHIRNRSVLPDRQH